MLLYLRVFKCPGFEWLCLMIILWIFLMHWTLYCFFGGHREHAGWPRDENVVDCAEGQKERKNDYVNNDDRTLLKVYYLLYINRMYHFLWLQNCVLCCLPTSWEIGKIFDAQLFIGCYLLALFCLNFYHLQSFIEVWKWKFCLVNFNIKVQVNQVRTVYIFHNVLWMTKSFPIANIF